MKKILNEYFDKIALIIGNGINRYGPENNNSSWESLLEELALGYRLFPNKNNKLKFSELIKGLSLTEFYDIVDMKANQLNRSTSFQQEFCSLMKDWPPKNHHFSIANWAQHNSSPILTTNFENTLGKSTACKLSKIDSIPGIARKNFTDYYPWSSYYGTGKLSNPIDGFGIWHMNGMEYYPRSIRLGLTHYMGSVERARAWFHKGKNSRLFSGKSMSTWKGSQTWLNIIFNKPLLIFGLALEENEVFLRWLLLERARYFNKFPNQSKKAWYVYPSNEKLTNGKRMFLEGVGITPYEVHDYDSIYSDQTWGRA
ncbi:hypothetical protein [Kiloniella sp.]|uniref:hypothetical protein n=1 Tax=Kiloniella sp. TaxID=1938587 RepID=UPI003A93030A